MIGRPLLHEKAETLQQGDHSHDGLVSLLVREGVYVRGEEVLNVEDFYVGQKSLDLALVRHARSETREVEVLRETLAELASDKGVGLLLPGY